MIVAKPAFADDEIARSTQRIAELEGKIAAMAGQPEREAGRQILVRLLESEREWKAQLEQSHAQTPAERRARRDEQARTLPARLAASERRLADLERQRAALENEPDAAPARQLLDGAISAERTLVESLQETRSLGHGGSHTGRDRLVVRALMLILVVLFVTIGLHFRGTH